jgi:predicted DNA-binding transcriptional regulator YafY
MNRLDRISAILVQLQSRSVLRAADCAARFGVSVRTIYRDMRSLEEAGVPICGDAGVGYSLVEGYRLPPLMFTQDEALALLTSEKFIEQLTDPHNARLFHQGMDKVRAVMRGVQKERLEDLGGKIAVYRSRNTPAAKRSNLLQTILHSIGDRVILDMEYTNADRSVSRREVEAVGVTFSNPFWYLTAWCHLRGEYRTFRLDRIDDLKATGRAHTIAEHPPLDSLVGRDDYACLTRVVIRTDATTARRHSDVNYFMGLAEGRESEDGRVEQTYMSYSAEAMARWVLAHADTTSVVEPAEVNEYIKKIIECYEDQQHRDP